MAARRAAGGEMTFLEHFEELRRRIYWTIIGFCVAFALCTAFLTQIMQVLVAPYYRYLPEGQRALAYTEITEVFFLYMKVAAIAGVFVAAPWIFLQLWLFIAPGLKPREKRMALPFVVATSLFFMAGMVFCYFFVLPYTFKFFYDFNKGFTNVVTVTYFWSFTMKFLLGMGLVFETPILILFLTRLGIVSTGFLLRKFKWAVLIAFTVAAVITPSGDPVNQTIVAVPILVLYLLGILISWIFKKRAKPEEQEEG
jgi:sec-independent protein translocase protein TatC